MTELPYATLTAVEMCLIELRIWHCPSPKWHLSILKVSMWVLCTHRTDAENVSELTNVLKWVL